MKRSFFAPVLTLSIAILFLQQISSADALSPETACAHTEDPHLCILVIKSDPRSSNGNMRKYCVIVLEKVLSKAEGLKSICPKAYEKLVYDIGEAIEKLQTKQPVATVVGSVKSAIKDVGSCIRGDASLLKLLQIALDVLKIIKK